MSRKTFKSSIVQLGLVAALGLSNSIAPTAAETRKNASFCTEWSYGADGRFYGHTRCEFGTEIQFMSQANGLHLIATGYGARLFTGLTKADIESGWWMYTTCAVRVGGRPLKPDVPFTPENRDRIKAGDYKCVGE